MKRHHPRPCGFDNNGFSFGLGRWDVVAEEIAYQVRQGHMPGDDYIEAFVRLDLSAHGRRRRKRAGKVIA